METFKKFLSDFFDAIRHKDAGFLKNVYSEWMENSGAVPDEEKEKLLASLPEQLATLASAKLKSIEEYDGYHIAKLDSGGSEIEMVFAEKGGSYFYFNGQSNLKAFKKVYSIGYIVEGGRLRVIVNGKRNPFIGDIGDSGFASPINSALKKGSNEITLQALSDAPIEASIKISSAKRGEIVDTNQADVLDWKGTIKGSASLKFDAE